MKRSERDVLDFIQENDVKFVKLAFCDALGNLKNVSLFAEQLEGIFEKGMPIEEEAFDGIASYENGDIRLYPDPSTLQVLPWRPQHGSVVRMYCHLKHADGTIAECDGRVLLKNAQDKLSALGYTCIIGSDCDFYLFEQDEKGNPTNIPFDKAGYLDAAPLDKGEDIRREICFSLESFGIKPSSSHHEKGPGQNEIRFSYNDALLAADDLITFKSTVKSIAAKNGLYASFLPKPLDREEGSALRVNVQLKKDGETCPMESNSVKSFLAGILNRIAEITLFLNPTPNSYDRFNYATAPKYIGWATSKFHQVIKVSAHKATINSADPACNPYVAYALLLYAGAEGIENNMELPSPVSEKITSINDGEYKPLPLNLGEAIKLAKGSNFVKEYIPSKHLAQYIEYKENELEDYAMATSKEKFLNYKYFGRI